MAFIVEELSARIGASIATDAQTLTSGKHSAEIRGLLEQRGVLVFPGLGLTDEQQIAFARTLGPLEQELYKVSFDKEHNPEYAEYTRGTFSWHIDRIDLDVPPLGSMLTARVLAPSGGETEFANTYAAYEDLPEDRKAYLETLQAVHTIASSYRELPEISEELRAFADKFEPKVQPLVWQHRSGRKSLAIGVHACGIVGMAQDEADGLLAELLEWATRPQYVLRHSWRLGDTVIWDNTGTMHRAMPYDHNSGRLMHRTKLEGEEAFA